jgi:hypothetical protein
VGRRALTIAPPPAPTLLHVEILLWLVPSVVVTLVAMAWVAWLGREGRGEVDRDVAVTRLAAAMQREHSATRHQRPVAPRDRSTGIAVRPSRAPRAGTPGGGPSGTPGPGHTRRSA